MQNEIFVTKSSMPSLDEYVEEIKDIWDSHCLTNMGPKHVEFQKRLKEYMDVRYIELLTNGHMALELTLQAMGVTGQVITTPFTFASTTHAIVRNGLEPVFCDIDTETYTMDVSKIEKLITKETSAILPVHVYGMVCNIEEIDEIAKKYGLKVIYDAAHTFGETYKNVGIGNYGDASIFSFHATKVFNTIEGGAVTFNNSELGDKLYNLKNFGIQGPESVIAVGSNAKMNEFCAAMGICNLRHLDEEIYRRKQVVDRYCERLEGQKGVILPKVQKDVKANYAYFPVVFDEMRCGVTRDDIFKELEKHGVYARKYFYPLTNSFDVYKEKYSVENTPVAEYISKRVLTLPLYADLEQADIDKICNIIWQKIG